jgi:hypothetical protein
MLIKQSDFAVFNGTAIFVIPLKYNFFPFAKRLLDTLDRRMRFLARFSISPAIAGDSKRKNNQDVKQYYAVRH